MESHKSHVPNHQSVMDCADLTMEYTPTRDAFRLNDDLAPYSCWQNA